MEEIGVPGENYRPAVSQFISTLLFHTKMDYISLRTFIANATFSVKIHTLHFKFSISCLYDDIKEQSQITLALQNGIGGRTNIVGVRLVVDFKDLSKSENRFRFYNRQYMYLL